MRLRLRGELPAVLSAREASGQTHDPEEAMAICSRNRDGYLHQCASPRELFDSPATLCGSLGQHNVLPVWVDSAEAPVAPWVIWKAQGSDGASFDEHGACGS